MLSGINIFLRYILTLKKCDVTYDLVSQANEFFREVYSRLLKVYLFVQRPSDLLLN
jgi:hypothetical protein